MHWFTDVWPVNSMEPTLFEDASLVLAVGNELWSKEINCEAWSWVSMGELAAAIESSLFPPSIEPELDELVLRRCGGKPCFLKQLSTVWLSLPQKVQTRELERGGILNLWI
jgi:hypothetical protein